MRDLRVRTKLAAVLTLPLVGFLVVAGVQVTSAVRAAVDLDGLSRQIELGREVTGLVHELQRERDRTVGLLAGLSGRPAVVPNFADLAPDRTAVDRALAAFHTAVRPLRGDPAPQARVEDGLNQLDRIRDGAESGWLRGQAVFDSYSRIIADLQALIAIPAAAGGAAWAGLAGGDAALGQAVRAFANVTRAKELAAQVRGRLLAVCGAGGFTPGEFEAIANIRAQRQAAVERFRSDAGPTQATAYDDALSGQAVRTASRLEQTVVDNAGSVSLGVDAQQWWQASTTALERMRGVELSLLSSAIAAASARSSAQWRTTALSSLASGLLLLIALLTSFLVGRGMVETLHSLREQALDIAQRRLPRLLEQLRGAHRPESAILVEPIAIRSADEVGEVAEAFTAVHRSAVRLAAEQALMRQNVDAIFVNLARRSQTLVERQLQVLDALETSEANEEQLGNLFRLDHLATRLRRNDDNLLVLAGGEATRRWTDPVPLADIVLAAAAEIENYDRVRHDITDDIHLVGHAVADVVHLIAELLENATVFSPPDTTVTVLGWTGADGGAAMVIEDRGIGMSAEAVTQANQQVAVPVSIDVAAAERMGLVVVGHLAYRHGIQVELRSAGVGVIVMIAFPARLLAEPPATPVSLSGGPARRLRGSIVADDVDAGPGPAVTTGPAALPRRATPTRAEDVLGAGRVDTASVWWSRRGAAAGGVSAGGGGAAAPPRRPAPTMATNEAGLPVRVPMAHLPQAPEPAAVAVRPVEEPDPQQVRSMLSRFYGGVHRAAEEDDDDLQPVT
jgi:hypothetical protein